MAITALSHWLVVRAGSSSSKVERTFADFLVNGESLLHALVKVDGGHADFMSCFVQGLADENRRTAEKLLLSAEPDTERGGVLLYVCPECGDIACGAYSARVTRTLSGYAWHDFAYENGYEAPRLIEGVGPFHFALHEYEHALRLASAV